jgi:sodium-dependent phosphate transporter
LTAQLSVLLFERCAYRVFTLFVGGIISAAIFSWGTFAPSKQFGTEVLAYQNAIKGMTDGQLNALNTAAANGGAPASLSTINQSWSALTKDSKSHPWPSTTTPASDVINLATQANTLHLTNSNVTFKG